MKTLIITCLALFSFIFLKVSDTEQFNYSLDTEKSIIEWTGSGNNVIHNGSFDVTSKGIMVADGHIKSGSFTIPIISIKNFDLPEEVKPVLLDHLKSVDFFNMALFPEAHFIINNVENINIYANGEIESSSEVDGTNKMVYGDFTMLGKTFPIYFPAKITVDGDNIEVEAKFKLDRTKWGMDYGADPALGDHHIHPKVDIHLKLLANRKLS